MRLKAESYFAIFLMVVSIVIIIYSLTYPALQSKLPGILAGSVIIVLGLVQLFYKDLRVKGEQQTKEIETGTFVRKSGLLTIWLGGFIGASYVLGFLFSIPIFILAYLKANGTSWLTSIAYAVVTTSLVYGIFEFFLERQLWRGLFSFPP